MDVFLDGARHGTATSDSDPEIEDTDSIMAGANSYCGLFHLHHIPQWGSHPASTPISWEDHGVITARNVTEKEGQRATDRLEFGAGTTGVWRRGGRKGMGSGYDWEGDLAILDVRTHGIESAERSTVDWKSELELEHGTAGDPGVF